MSNYRIHTTLDVIPASAKCSRWHNAYIVTRGASAEFTLSFDEYSYLKPSEGDPWYQCIEQIYFLFRRGYEQPISYQLFVKPKSEQEFDPTVGPELTDRCRFDSERNCVSLLLSSDDTAAMEEDTYEYEIAISMDTLDSEEGHIVIERQDPVKVLDSLYREIMPSDEEAEG